MGSPDLEFAIARVGVILAPATEGKSRAFPLAQGKALSDSLRSHVSPFVTSANIGRQVPLYPNEGLPPFVLVDGGAHHLPTPERTPARPEQAAAVWTGH